MGLDWQAAIMGKPGCVADAFDPAAAVRVPRPEHTRPRPCGPLCDESAAIYRNRNNPLVERLVDWHGVSGAYAFNVGGAYKIGRTSSVGRRVGKMRTQAPFGIRLVALHERQDLETSLRERLASLAKRGNGEWLYGCTDDDVRGVFTGMGGRSLDAVFQLDPRDGFAPRPPGPRSRG